MNSKNNIDQLLLTKSYVITEKTSYNSDIQQNFGVFHKNFQVKIKFNLLNL